jgi:hypothetical protein
VLFAPNIFLGLADIVIGQIILSIPMIVILDHNWLKGNGTTCPTAFTERLNNYVQMRITSLNADLELNMTESNLT